MGKPSRRQSRYFNHPLTQGSSTTMNSKKLRKKRRESHSKTQNNIKKLFNVLRNESNTTINSEDSIDTVDGSLEIVEDNPNKRKLSATDLNQEFKRSKNNSLIIINDDNDVSNIPSTSTGTPRKPSTVQCSTPINKKNKVSLADLIISNFPNSKNNNTTVQNFNEEVVNLTKEINKDSFVTVDLTTETLDSTASKQNTIIDLVNTDNDCTVVSVSNTSLSMSGDSAVTVLNVPPKNSTEREMRKAFRGLSKLGPTEKGKMLEYVVTQILNGCNVPENVQTSLNIRKPDTVEDAYIKEVIVGQTQSRNSIGSNIYNPESDAKNKTGLRMVVIDGSNVAMEHGRGQVFSVKGLKICIDYFLKRGHVVKAFVPRFRCKFGKSSDPRLLDDLERRGLVVYTPSREIQGRLVTSYDDRYIVQCAAEFDGVIVSGDNYRDLMLENPRWRFVIENRWLPFTWVNDMIMFPRDPLGRNGPMLEHFLRHGPVPSLFRNF